MVGRGFSCLQIVVLFCAIALSFALRADSLNVGNETITYTSGDHTYDSATFGNTGVNGSTSRLRVSGGSLTISGTTTMNGYRNNTKSDLVICGNATAALGTIANNNSWSVGGASSYFTVSNDAQVTFGNYNGQACNSGWAYMTFTDNARVIQNDGCSVSMPGAGSAVSPNFLGVVKGHAYVEFAALNLLNSHSFIRTEDHATLVIRGSFSTLNPARDQISASGDSTIIARGYTSFAYGGSGMVLSDRARFIQASNCIDLGWNGSPNVYLTVSNQAAIVSTNKINVGRASADDTPHVFIRLCGGGTLEFPGFQYGRTAYWANDTYKRSMTNLYCEGGVMRPLADNTDFIRYWKYAQLVGAGLTVDTAGHATGVEQAFVGTTFTKTGLGTLTTRLESVHDTTAVAKGTLLFGAAVSTFGSDLVVTNGAAVSTEGAATGLVLRSLTLGNATSAGRLVLDGGDTVSVATAAGLHLTDGQLFYGFADTDGTYDLITVGSGVATAAQLAGLKVANGVVGKKYKFTIAANGSGSIVRLTVSSSIVVENTWSGAVSTAWRMTGNWSRGEYPDDVTRAIFPANATRKSVAIANADEAYRMEIHGAYSFSGAGSLATGAFLVDAGTSTFAVPIPVSGDLAVSMGAGSALTLSGALTGADSSTLTKTGKGTLTVSGANAGYSGGWASDAGTLAFSGTTATGTTEPTTAISSFRGGTVAFSGAGQVMRSSVETDPGATTAMVFNASGTATIHGGIDSKSGGFILRGTGRLTLAYGATTTKVLAKNDLSKEGQMPPSGAILFPADGASPSYTVLSSVNVLSGTLALEGVGRTATDIRELGQNHIVGGNWADAPTSARWELSRASFYAGNNDHWFVIGNKISSANATHPTLSVGTDGYFESTCTYLGRENSSFAQPVYPTLAATNGTAASYFSTYFGADAVTSRLHPVVRIGAGGSVYQRHTGRANKYGIHVGHDVDGELADGGGMTSSAWGLYLTAAASGEIRVVNNGYLNVSYVSSRDPATTTDPFRIVFDGGRYIPACAHTTSVHNASLRTMELCGAGMIYSSSYDHTLAMRVTGSGGLVKNGSKKLTFAADNECLAHSNETAEFAGNDRVTLGPSGYRTADFTGALDIRAGTVALEPGSARPDLKAEVASGTALDLCGGSAEAYRVGGSGTVKNADGGTLTVMAGTNTVITLDNIRSDLVLVDFARYGGTLVRKQVVTVAQLANGCSIAEFKSKNCGDKIRGEFSVSDTGLVTAKMVSKQGLAVYILTDPPVVSGE